MSIAVHCVHCNGRFSAPDHVVGKSAPCPNCGHEVAVHPEAEFEPPIIQVSQADIDRATSGPGSRLNAVVIGTSIAVTLLTVATIGYLVLKTDSPFVRIASADDEPPQDLIDTNSPIRDETESVGLGFSLNEFKASIPIGKHWKVLSESTHESGRVSFQLLSTEMRVVLLIVAGRPNNLDEVSLTYSVVEGQSNADTLARIVAMASILAKYSDWTEEEIGVWWVRCIQIGADEKDDDRFSVQKNHQKLWMTPMGVVGGTMFMTGVVAKPRSNLPTLQQWLAAHPLPRPKSGISHYYASENSGKVANARVSFRNFRHKGRGDFIGEFVNESGRSYQVAAFKLSMYDANGSLIDTGTVMISDFKSKEVRTFDVYVDDPPSYYSYKFDLENSF